MSDALASHLCGDWQLPTAPGTAVADAVTGDEVCRVSSEGLDLGAALDHARQVGGPALRALTFPERAALLKSAALALGERKDELYALSARAGCTRADAQVDVDGGVGTALVYAGLGRKELPDDTVLVEDPEPIPLSRSGGFAGQHVLTSPRGVALQVNAFNFPVWGMLEKLAPALLAGVPSVVKPATPTAYVAQHAVRILVEAEVLPAGALQLVCGSIPGVLDSLGGHDSVAFTGSAATAAKLRAHPAVTARSTRFVAEADSLNASVLGPDAVAGSPEFDLFVDQLVTEMTVKAGQKCTAIRRAFVPTDEADAVAEALVERLRQVVVGAPGADGATMGALVGLAQREEVRGQLDRLAGQSEILVGDREKVEVVGADPVTGAFMSPVLLRAGRDARAPHEVEAFGPISTLLPYDPAGGDPAADLVEQVARGEGSLVASVVSADPDFVRGAVLGIAADHGRVLVLDRDSAPESTGHGTPMPQLVHGGPGRAGGGEEEGGLRAVRHHLQRTAVQGSPSVLAALGR